MLILEQLNNSIIFLTSYNATNYQNFTFYPVDTHPIPFSITNETVGVCKNWPWGLKVFDGIDRGRSRSI